MRDGRVVEVGEMNGPLRVVGDLRVGEREGGGRTIGRDRHVVSHMRENTEVARQV